LLLLTILPLIYFQARRLIEFIDQHGTQFQDKPADFDMAWAKFLSDHAVDEQHKDDKLSPLIR
jgi:hypothetical protein